MANKCFSDFLLALLYEFLLSNENNFLVKNLVDDFNHLVVLNQLEHLGNFCSLVLSLLNFCGHYLFFALNDIPLHIFKKLKPALEFIDLFSILLGRHQIHIQSLLLEIPQQLLP